MLVCMCVWYVYETLGRLNESELISLQTQRAQGALEIHTHTHTLTYTHTEWKPSPLIKYTVRRA